MKRFVHYILLLVLLTLTTTASAQKHQKHPHNAEATVPDSMPAARGALTEGEDLVEEVMQNPGLIRRQYNKVERGDSGTWLFRLQDRLTKACDARLFETTQVGICVYDLTDKQLIFALNQTHRMRPASSMKVITSVAGLHYLGVNYTFDTRLYYTGQVVDSLRTLRGDVYVVGGMDPLLGDQDLSTMARRIKQMGVDSIQGRLYMDVSMRKDAPMGWGWCWDDDYGPLTALMYNKEDLFAPNWIRALADAGVWVGNKDVDKKALPLKGAKQITVRSHNINEVLQPILKKSHNICAESLFYAIAAKGGKRGVTHKDAARYVNQLITSFSLQPELYEIADGSGLSLYDYVTPQLLVRFLRHAWDNTKIRSVFYPSLPIAGVDGTLKSRMKDTKAEGNVHAKTGTVTGVSSLTGYCEATNGHQLAFCIINQGVAKTSQGRQFQDKLCEIMCSTK